MSVAASTLEQEATQYLPDNLPVEFQAFDTPVESLGAGASTKLGLLDLTLAPSAGITRIVRQAQRGLLYIFRPIYIDPARPDMAFVYMIQMGDGMVQGDRYRLDLECQPGSAVHFTTQAASKLYRMEQNFATQIVNLNAGAGAYVEYLPDPVIPFRGARFYQRFNLTVDPTASAIVGEMLLPGRVAHGEAHAYTLYFTDLEARAADGTLLFVDRIALQPGQASPQTPGRLGPYDVLASLYVVTRQVPARDLADALSGCLAEFPEPESILIGVSELPNECGVIVRILGSRSQVVRAALLDCWNASRQMLIGVPAPDLRKG